MANEKRLIDANKLTAVMRNLADHVAETNPIIAATMLTAIDIVAEQKTVDAVEVVRCKDCKQWSRNSGIAESPNGHCFYHCIDTNGHDFCSYGSYGERKVET